MEPSRFQDRSFQCPLEFGAGAVGSFYTFIGDVFLVCLTLFFFVVGRVPSGLVIGV